MVLIPVTCPYCHSDHVIKGGKTDTGKQRYRGLQTDCAHRSFVLDPAYKGRLPQVKEQSGLRATTRTIMGPTRVISTLMNTSLASARLRRLSAST